MCLPAFPLEHKLRKSGGSACLSTIVHPGQQRLSNFLLDAKSPSAQIHCPEDGSARGPEHPPGGVWCCLPSTSSLITATRLAATSFRRVFFFFLLHEFYPCFPLEHPSPDLANSYSGSQLKFHFLPKAIPSSGLGALLCAP